MIDSKAKHFFCFELTAYLFTVVLALGVQFVFFHLGERSNELFNMIMLISLVVWNAVTFYHGFVNRESVSKRKELIKLYESMGSVSYAVNKVRDTNERSNVRSSSIRFDGLIFITLFALVIIFHYDIFINGGFAKLLTDSFWATNDYILMSLGAFFLSGVIVRISILGYRIYGWRKFMPVLNDWIVRVEQEKQVLENSKSIETRG